MTTVGTQPSTNRPYPPPSNVSTVLHRLRNRNLPETVDAEYLRDAGIPEGTNARTLYSMRFLGLIGDANEPTAALRTIAASTDEEYMTRLAELVREAYSEVFVSVDPGQDPQDVIVNFFRRYTPASQRNRMVIFFLGMCREAGIPTLDSTHQRNTNAPPTNVRVSKPRTPKPDSVKQPRDSRPPSDTIPALSGLIESLPPVGSVFPVTRRQQWLDMVQATLAYLYLDEIGTESTAE